MQQATLTLSDTRQTNLMLAVFLYIGLRSLCKIINQISIITQYSTSVIILKHQYLLACYGIIFQIFYLFILLHPAIYVEQNHVEIICEPLGVWQHFLNKNMFIKRKGFPSVCIERSFMGVLAILVSNIIMILFICSIQYIK